MWCDVSMRLPGFFSALIFTSIVLRYAPMSVAHAKHIRLQETTRYCPSPRSCLSRWMQSVD